MEKGLSFKTRYIEKNLSEEMKSEIDELVLECKSCKMETPSFVKELNDYYNLVTIGDGKTIIRYTGFDYKFINAALRNSWNYEEHGKKDDKKIKQLLEYANHFSSLIDLFPETNSTFMVYRGTTIQEFKDYGISSLEDLMALKGKYIYENGFTSTSIEEASSFYNKNSGYRTIRNIEVKYIIPKGSQDGIPLLKEEISYSKSEMEYLINKDALSKIIDVKIEGENAIITAVLIPKRIWNKPQKVDASNYKK